MTVFVPTMVSLDSHTAPAVRTLVVDDSVVVRTVIERILNADPGFTVVHKTNSAENALRYLAEHSVDLVLLDIELPGQSGLAALPAILQAGAGVKVAILSGKCEEGSAAAVEALALGASDILSKPGSGSFGEQFPHALVERLDARGVPLYAITNFGAEFWAGFRPMAPVFDRFRDIVVSGEEKLAKPDRAIFTLAEQRFGYPAQAMLFIDDNRANIDAAAQFGWQVHHFTDAPALEADLVKRALI